MRKSGLHKQIAFIFEGDPTPDSAAKEPLTMKKQAVSQEKSTSKATDVSGGGALTPDRRVSRIKPAPRVPLATEPNGLQKLGRWSLKKKPQSADASANRRQKTMTLMVGVLSVVFLGVMVFSFGGIGETNAASVRAASTPAAAATPQFDPKSWVFPDPLPEQMRNPLVIPKAQLAPAADETTPGMMEVSGIVYSEKRPSVIIDGEVVLEGQLVKGVTVLKITRGAVEFEKDGKRWTQRIR